MLTGMPPASSSHRHSAETQHRAVCLLQCKSTPALVTQREHWGEWDLHGVILKNSHVALFLRLLSGKFKERVKTTKGQIKSVKLLRLLFSDNHLIFSTLSKITAVN